MKILQLTNSKFLGEVVKAMMPLTLVSILAQSISQPILYASSAILAVLLLAFIWGIIRELNGSGIELPNRLLGFGSALMLPSFMLAIALAAELKGVQAVNLIYGIAIAFFVICLVGYSLPSRVRS